MPESPSGWTTWEWTEHPFSEQYNRLEVEESPAGAKALTVARKPSRNHDSAETCVLCSRAGNNATLFRPYRIITRDLSKNGRR